MTTRFSVKAEVDAVIKDLGVVAKKIVPKISTSTLNQVSLRHVERPALRAISRSTGLPLGVVRWKHTADGHRTRKSRILRRGAKKRRQAVEWRWATGTGGPGTVGLHSIPGRRQTRTGIRAAQRSVPGGFLAVSRRSGRPVALKRKGRERYPVEILSVDLDSAGDISFGMRVRSSGPVFRRELERRLRVALARKGG